MTVSALLPGVPYGHLPRVAVDHREVLALPPLVVIHDTGHLSQGSTGTIVPAVNEANYAATRTDDPTHWTSAHFYVDDRGPLGSTPLDIVAWSAFHWANHHGWHIEMCGMNAGSPGAVPRATVAETTRLVARLLVLSGQPAEHLGPAQVADLTAGRRTQGGVCGHWDITQGLGVGTHDDPGPTFDWSDFIARVRLIGALTDVTRDTEETEMWAVVPDGVAFHPDDSWADITRALAVPVPKVGPTDWGDRWVWIAGNQEAVVRVVWNGGGWSGQDVAVHPADGGHVVALPVGTTEVYVGYKSGAGATVMVKGNR